MLYCSSISRCPMKHLTITLLTLLISMGACSEWFEDAKVWKPRWYFYCA